MTTMDSDSESQDSDDGRRFRFEATRKDSFVPVDMSNTDRSSKRSKHNSHCESNKRHPDKKERPKHESGRKMDDKDLRHFTKHSKHESWSSRQEDGSRNSYMSGSSRNNDDAKEKSRDSKRQSERDRNIRVQRSREHSYERSHNERTSSDKHRSRCHERHKHRARDKSRDRSYQSNKIKSLNGDRSREDHSKDFSRKILIKENKSQNSRDYSSPKNVERSHSRSEARSIIPSSENIKKDSSVDMQDCKDVDLSQFDVLSETDGNISDGPDSQTQTSSPHRRGTKLRKYDQSSHEIKHARKRQEELRKVKTGNNDAGNDDATGSSNNNPSAVSDSSLSFASSATVFVTREACADSAKENFEHREERMITCDSSNKRSDSAEKYLQCPNTSDEIRSLEKNAKSNEAIYGPRLPTELASNDSDGERLEETSSNIDTSSRHKVQSNTIDDSIDGEGASFIGPRLPRVSDMENIESRSNDRQRGQTEDIKDVTIEEADMAFGPALPPHLLQQKRDNDSRNKIIGPVLSSTIKASCNKNSDASMESDDDCAIGPLPADHPALKNSRVHEQLDLRAQRIRDEGYLEEVDTGNKREEWMTDLPPAQVINFELGPRKFKFRDGPDMSDRSCWTDTPAQKAQKQKDLEMRRFSDIYELDKKHTKDHRGKEADKRKHEKSLLEIHQSKMAKKEKKEEKEAKLTGISTRRPFNRDIDLQINRFDQAQKKRILMKAQLLDDRFSRGQI